MATAPLSPEQSQALGRAARVQVPRNRKQEWHRPDEGTASDRLRAQESIRAPELLPLRYGRMIVSPWTYFRGAAAVMTADLAGCPHSGLLVQMCGDAHVLKIGLWATPERQLAFALRDFDETLPGPFEWDVKRLVASPVVVARENGHPDKVGLEAVRACVTAYRQRMRRYSGTDQLTIWYDAIHVEELLAHFDEEATAFARRYISKKARKRGNKGAFYRLTEKVGAQVRIRENPPARFTAAMTHFARSFADRNKADHAALATAAEGEMAIQPGG